MKFRETKETFEKAQEAALQAGDDLGELMAIGMLQLVTTLDRELKGIRSDLDQLRRQQK
jgi:hypothetical protein